MDLILKHEVMSLIRNFQIIDRFLNLFLVFNQLQTFPKKKEKC